jgi:hypothetical protein
VVIPGMWIWSSGVPGGTSTVTVIVWPVASVTTRVRWSADAGRTATETPTVKPANASTPAASLRFVFRIRNVSFPPLASAQTSNFSASRAGRRPITGRGTVPVRKDARNEEPLPHARLQALVRASHPQVELDISPPPRAAGTLRDMSETDTEGLRERLARQGEDALGKLAQDLLENPLINGAIARAFEAREKAVQAQEVAMGALNIPSAADVERLTRRLRSVSQRLEGIEDGVDRLDQRLGALAAAGGLEPRLTAIEEGIAALTKEIAALREAIPDGARPVPREQERLDVEADGKA